MMKRILVGAILTVFLVFAVATSAYAGGGPAPGCYVDYNGYPGAIHASAGEVVYMEVYVSSCPATATTDWGNGQIQLFQDDQLNAVSWQYFEVPQDVVNDTTYILNLDATDGVNTFHKEARLVVGNPPSLPLQLTFNMKRVYWENYSAYTARILSADYVLKNVGTKDAYNVWLGENQPTNGVLAVDNPFNLVSEKLPAGGSIDPIIRGYQLPPGTNYFKTFFGVQAEDLNGHTQTFGSLPPQV